MTTNSAPGLFGKAPALLDVRTIALASVAPVGVINAPPSLGWAQQVDGWGMLGNDIIGDCVEAAMLHQDMVWTRLTRPGTPPLWSDGDAEQLYSAITGYVPAQGDPGPGTVYLDAMKFWRQRGIKATAPLWAYGSVDYLNRQAMNDAIYAFGGVQLGFSFPTDMDWSLGYWVPTNSPGDPSRGHGVCVVDYDDMWYWCISWGKLYAMTRAFAEKYSGECYFCVSEDWQRNPATPAGVDLSAVAEQMATQLQVATA